MKNSKYPGQKQKVLFSLIVLFVLVFTVVMSFDGKDGNKVTGYAIGNRISGMTEADSDSKNILAKKGDIFEYKFPDGTVKTYEYLEDQIILTDEKQTLQSVQQALSLNELNQQIKEGYFRDYGTPERLSSKLSQWSGRVSDIPSSNKEEDSNVEYKQFMATLRKERFSKEEKQKILVKAAPYFAEVGNNKLSARLYSEIGENEKAGEQWGIAGEYEKAARDYKRAVKKDPKKADLIIKEIDDMISQLEDSEEDKGLMEKLEKEKSAIKNIEFINSPEWKGKEFDWIEDNVFTVMEGYPALAGLFYKGDNMWLDDTFSNWLSGPDGIAAEMCKQDVMADVTGGAGFSFSQSVTGAYAHIEGERITEKNYTATGETTSYYYKVSFEVDSGSSSTGCGLRFTTYLRGSGSEDALVTEDNSTSAKEWDLERGEEETVSYAGTEMIVIPSTKLYDEVCIKFEEITLRAGRTCLIGIEEGDYLCNAIKESGAE